jgi:hypothetical protein
MPFGRAAIMNVLAFERRAALCDAWPSAPFDATGSETIVVSDTVSGADVRMCAGRGPGDAGLYLSDTAKKSLLYTTHRIALNSLAKSWLSRM